MKSEAYKALVDIERILSSSDIYVKRGKQLPITLISELDKLGDLSKSIEAYLKATDDKVIISKVSMIPRAIFHKLMAWYDIPKQTRLSIAFCSKSLCDIAAMGQNEIKQDEQEKNLPTELDTTEAKKKPTEQKQRGRKTKSFIDCFLKEPQQADFEKVRRLCSGKKGKELALVILVAIEEGIISKPTFRAIEKECNNVGSESGFCSYMNKGLKAYTKEEITGTRKLLSV